jgi:XTP/dITP diphosphohydrolase
MADPPILVLGTFNRKKGEELVHLLTLPWLGVRTLAEMPRVEEVAETGDRFAANAALKAAGYARQLRSWTLGEDSGLEVEALDGAPGVFSARFSGPGATDETNNRLLLERLDGVPDARRAARYVCHMVLADPSGAIRAESQGTCRGRIIRRPRGTHGFGYDPLFEIPEYHRTFGELGPAAKAALSHRARAARQLRPALERLLGGGAASSQPRRRS